MRAGVVGAKSHLKNTVGKKSLKALKVDAEAMSDMHKALKMLMNRSGMKAIVDPVERSVAMGEDVVKKMMSVSQAVGKDPVAALKMLGSKL
jgi:hypothetical protein